SLTTREFVSLARSAPRNETGDDLVKSAPKPRSSTAEHCRLPFLQFSQSVITRSLVSREVRAAPGSGVQDMRQLAFAVCVCSAIGLGGLFLSLASAQQVYRDGFETRETAWVKGAADAPFKETLHRTTEDLFHTGQRCEYLELTAERGTYIYYNYDTAAAP